jgi:hypothetical protein
MGLILLIWKFGKNENLIFYKNLIKNFMFYLIVNKKNIYKFVIGINHDIKEFKASY